MEKHQPCSAPFLLHHLLSKSRTLTSPPVRLRDWVLGSGHIGTRLSEIEAFFCRKGDVSRLVGEGRMEGGRLSWSLGGAS